MLVRREVRFDCNNSPFNEEGNDGDETIQDHEDHWQRDGKTHGTKEMSGRWAESGDIAVS